MKELKAHITVPRLEGSDLDTGERRTTVTSTCSEDDAGVLTPQRQPPVDNATTERTRLAIEI